VRDGETVTSDPMGPLPAGREAWISPVVMALRDRPPEPTWWTRHRRQVVLAIAAVCLGGLVTVVIVRPATLETIGFVAIVVIVFALRFSLGRRPDDGQHATRWFPRE